MQDITNWLMVIITAIYVIATIIISISNYKSASASAEQLSEMKKEYEEENRPDVEVEFHFIRKSFLVLKFINRGRHNAEHTHILFDDQFIESLEDEQFKQLVSSQNGRECIIGPGQAYDIYFGTNKYRKIENKAPAAGSVTYYYKGKEYKNDFFIDIDNYLTIFSTDTDQDDLLKVLKDQRRELGKIGDGLKEMSIAVNKK